MSSFADRWQAADEDDWVPPAGTYKAKVVDATGFISRAGNESAKVRLEVTDGAFSGKQWDHMMFFSNPVGTRISKGNLAMYGMDVAKMSDWYEVEEAMPTLLGKRVEVTVKHNGDYVNTDVIRSFTGRSDVTDDSDQQAFQPTPVGAEDDDDEPLPY